MIAKARALKKRTKKGRDPYHSLTDPEASIRYGMLRDEGHAHKSAMKILSSMDYDV